LAVVGGNGNRRVSGGEQDEVHREAGATAVATGERMDGGDSVMESRGAFDGIRDCLDFKEEFLHQVGKLHRIRRHVIGTGDTHRKSPIAPILYSCKQDLVKIAQIALREQGIRAGELFDLVPSFCGIDCLKMILEQLAGNGDAF
jgi:hypothetical protein